MITLPPGIRVLVWPVPVDFRRGMDSLAALVQVTLRLDPFAGDVFVFRSRRPDRVKSSAPSSFSSSWTDWLSACWVMCRVVAAAVTTRPVRAMPRATASSFG